MHHFSFWYFLSPLVVAAEVQSEEEEQTEDEKYNEMLASISMSRMKELGLKPPEAIANLESLPPNLGQKLDNMTEQALGHVNKTKINEKLKGTEKLINPPPGAKRPKVNGKKDPNKITILRVPSSPGQELLEEVPGVKPLELPGEDDNGDKENKDTSKNKGGQKAKPPPAQEGGKDGETELSVGESGDEGPPEGQDKEEEPVDLPNKEQKLKKIKPKKPKSKKKKKADNKAPELPDQLKNPDLKIPQQPTEKAPSPSSQPSSNYYGMPGYKKHEVGEKNGATGVTLGGKKVANVKSKENVKYSNEEEAGQEVAEDGDEKEEGTSPFYSHI